nr:MAG TPA: hypothetical protein [Caudoviricetes sp.]
MLEVKIILPIEVVPSIGNPLVLLLYGSAYILDLVWSRIYVE